MRIRIPILVQGAENRIYRWAVWLYLFLLIFEGALRKWILPGLATPLLLVREPIVIWLVYEGLRKGWFRSKLVITMIIASTISLVATMIVGHHDPFVAFYGWRIYFFHFPMIFVIERVLTRDDLFKMMKFILYVSIPMTILVVAQFYSPENAWVNIGVGGEGTAGFSGAKGYMRPPGTFSFTNGYVGFQGMVGCILLYYLMMNETMDKKYKLSTYIMVIAAVCYLVSIPTSISRTHFFQTMVFIMFLAVAALRKNSLKTKFINASFLVGLGLVIIILLGIGDTQIDAFITRFDNASKIEGGTSGVLGGRYLGGLIRPLLTAFDMPFWGYGIGLGTNVGSKYMGGNMYSFGFNAEKEWGRIMGECGFLIGIVIILCRLLLSVKIFKLSYKNLVRGGNMLSWILVAYVLLNAPQGQWGQPTPLGFSVMSCGMALVGLKREQNK